MVHCRDIFAPIGEQVCDGSYIAFVMKKVNGPAQAKLGRGTLVSSNDCDRPGHPPTRNFDLTYMVVRVNGSQTDHIRKIDSIAKMQIKSRAMVVAIIPILAAMPVFLSLSTAF